MMDTYRVRHAVRDVGAALGMPPGETDAIAKAFPHIRAKDVRSAMAELPELRTRSLDGGRLTPSGPDRVRVKILGPTGEIVFDSEPGLPDLAPPAVPIASGTVVVR